MGENDRIADEVDAFFTSELARDARAFSDLVCVERCQPRTADKIVREWPWAPPGFTAHKNVGLYRPDVTVFAQGVPVMFVEVDASTGGKGAVGAVVMAALALMEARQTLLWPARAWFQVVTTKEKKQLYQDRLGYVWERFLEQLAGADRFALELGREVLIAEDVANLATWQRARPNDSQVLRRETFLAGPDYAGSREFSSEPG